MTSPISRPGGETPLRSSSASTTGSTFAKVFKAQVLSVNTRVYTVDVQYEGYPYSTHLDIPWMSPYLHQNQGEGIATMPEVGSTCWVCEPSETGRNAFVLGWAPVQEGGSYRAGRKNLNSGDMHFSTRDENFIFLRRGGIVQIGSTAICQRMYIPIRNIIRDMAENYELSTPAGDLTWRVNRTEEQGDGHRGCLFVLSCKEFSDDPNKDPLAVLKIGSHGEGQDVIFTLETREKGGGPIKTKLTINKSGDVDWTVEGDASLVFKKNLSIEVGESLSISSVSSMDLKSNASMSVSAPSISLASSGAAINLSGGVSLEGSSISLGDAKFPVVVATPSLLLWIQAVTALLSGLPTDPAFKGILPLVNLQSTKVKA